MKFTKLRKTRTYGNFQNISLEADIEDGDSIESVDCAIEKEIDKLINREKAIEDKKDEYSNLKYNIDSLKRQAENMERTIIKYRDFMKKHGIDVKDDLPF